MTTQSPFTPASAHRAADPRPLVLRAVEQATPLVAGVAGADLDRPTPCTDWTVRDLLAHLVAVERRVAHIVRGGHPFDVPTQVTDVQDDRWLDAWQQAASDLRVALDEPDVLDRTVAHPLGSFPAPVALGVYAGELAAHGWDLAA
ncbi:TIGR03086 family metal-binding protein, partial [Nocardioides sp.]|uniref:TIGR03086 family metal-binding protein n=1 Tax=Nocardioides sp. TaxID=35761 RepID=UPI0025E07FF5